MGDSFYPEEAGLSPSPIRARPGRRLWSLWLPQLRPKGEIGQIFGLDPHEGETPGVCPEKTWAQGGQ